MPGSRHFSNFCHNFFFEIWIFEKHVSSFSKMMVLSVAFGHGFLAIPFWFENMFHVRRTLDICCVLSYTPECVQHPWTFNLFWEKSIIQQLLDALQSQPINCVHLSRTLGRCNKAFCYAVRVVDVSLFFAVFFLIKTLFDVSVFCLYACQHTSCMCSAHRGQITALNFLGLELQTIVRHHVGVGSWTQFLWKDSQYSVSHHVGAGNQTWVL